MFRKSRSSFVLMAVFLSLFAVKYGLKATGFGLFSGFTHSSPTLHPQFTHTGVGELWVKCG